MHTSNIKQQTHTKRFRKDLSRDCNPFAFVGFFFFFSRIKKKYHASTLKCWLLVHLCLIFYGQIPFQFGDGFLLLKMKSPSLGKKISNGTGLVVVVVVVDHGGS